MPPRSECSESPTMLSGQIGGSPETRGPQKRVPDIAGAAMEERPRTLAGSESAATSPEAISLPRRSRREESPVAV